jgi:hypothetical protein
MSTKKSEVLQGTLDLMIENASGDGSASRIWDRAPIGAVERRGAPPERRNRLHVPSAVAAGRMDRRRVGHF